MYESRVVDLFSGIGGLSLGFENAGFNILVAYDNWDPAIRLYGKNIKTHPIVKLDLSDEARSIEEIKKTRPEIIIGGPPCQDFSSAGKRDENLGRADLTLSFAKIISSIKPKYFVMENVDRALKSRAFSEALKIFKASKYGITSRILDASYCGVPQLRKRLFVIGGFGEADHFLSEILVSNFSETRMTVRDYFGNSLGIRYYYRHPRSYARRAIFSIDEPSPTIRGVNRPLAKGYPGHSGDACKLNKNIRPLTTKERSMIQTFPANFVFEGTKTEIEQAIGNAVPVKLAEYVASCLLKFIKTKMIHLQP